MCLKERKMSLKFYIHLQKDAEFHIIRVLVVDIITDRVHLVYRVHVLNKNWINLIKHQGPDPFHWNFGVYIWADCHVCTGASAKLDDTVDKSLLQLFYHMCLSDRDVLDTTVYLKWQEILWHLNPSLISREGCTCLCGLGDRSVGSLGCSGERVLWLCWVRW